MVHYADRYSTLELVISSRSFFRDSATIVTAVTDDWYGTPNGRENLICGIFHTPLKVCDVEKSLLKNYLTSNEILPLQILATVVLF